MPNNITNTADNATIVGRFEDARVLIAGLGNIGSQLASLLAHSVAAMRLVDRDVVEARNLQNQHFGPEDVGRAKVDAIADRLQRQAPNLHVERRNSDLEDLPGGDFADIDLVFGALDSLAARRALSEKAYPLRVAYIDGAVGLPFDVRVQVLLPGAACLQCSWGTAQYQQISTEYPCEVGGSPAAPPTGTSAAVGAATAAIMAAQAARLMAADNPPTESYEITGDLLSGRITCGNRKRNDQCRYLHQLPAQIVPLAVPFADATVADLLAGVDEIASGSAVQLRLRRGILAAGLFGENSLTSSEQLFGDRHRTLCEFGFAEKDHVAIQAGEGRRPIHISFTNT